MTVEVSQATPYPAQQVALALSLTMSNDAEKELPNFTSKLARFIIEAEHTSVLEHVHYTFLIQNVSRSFLAQITRQRTAHPTSGSQHYQDYSGYPLMLSPDCVGNDDLKSSLNMSVGAYEIMLKDGIPKEEARQCLPNACAVNYLWTIDARNLMFFLRQRLCNRNALEMRIFANRVFSLAKNHFPELFNHVGPQCFMNKSMWGPLEACRQGKMQCEQGFWEQV